MSKYEGWAILSMGKFINDDGGAVGPALFSTRRSAQAWWKNNRPVTPSGKVVKVAISVKEIK